MAKLVSSVADIEKNIITLETFRGSTPAKRTLYTRLIKNGKLFVVLPSSRGYLFAPSRFAGYKNNGLGHERLQSRDGRKTNVQIEKLLGKAIDVGGRGYEPVDDAFVAYCKKQNIEPSHHHRARRYWLLPHARVPKTPVITLPEEGLPPSDLWEGTIQKNQLNRYERNSKARLACLRHHGSICKVCDIGLDEKYGDIGKGVVHVHHITPLSEIKKGYKVNPIEHLVPVCPNCHSILHRGDGMTIQDLRALVHSLRLD